MATTNIIDLTSSSVPYTGAVTLTKADEAYVVLLPRDCGSVAMQPVTNNALFSYDATPDSDMGDDAHTLTAGTITEWGVDRPVTPRDRGAYIYLQTASGGSKVVVSLRPRDQLYPE